VLARLLSTLLRSSGAHAPVATSAEISIGMAAYGNAATTRHALSDLFASVTGDFELILVNDCSPDDTLEVFREFARRHANTRIYSFDRNLEYCHSLNAFLSHAQGRLLLFLSNDIFANPSYLRQLLKAAAEHPECGILRGSSNFVDNSSPLHNVAAERFATKTAYLEFAADVARQHRSSPLVDERFLVGDAFLVTRQVIDRIGTVDTRFHGYCGDQDFALRARIAGFRVVLVRSAFVYHQNQANISYLPPDEQKRKIDKRIARVAEALTELQKKYGVAEQGSVHDFPWERLARQAFDEARHRVAPGDYSRYLLQR